MRKGDWEILAALYEYRNMTRASQALYISQPALSKRLQNIEKEYRCKIAIRNNKGIVLTPQGEYLGEQGVKYLQQLKDVYKHVWELNQSQFSYLRIGVPSSFARFRLPALLNEFHNLYPGIEVKVSVDTSTNIPDKLNSHSIQAGFVNVDPGSAKNAKLFMTRPGYLVYHKPISLDILPSVPYISHNRTSTVSSVIDSWWDHCFSVPQKTGMEVTDVETCFQMIKNGFGYTVVFLNPEEFNSSGEFFTLPLLMQKNKPLTRSTFFIYDSSEIDDPSLLAFVDFINSIAIG